MQNDDTVKLAAQIEALTRRLDEQQAEIEQLRGLAGEDAFASIDEPASEPTNRRGLLLAAAAAAAVFTPIAAQANLRTKVTVDTNAAFGAVGAPGVDPSTLLPALAATKHGVIGMADGKGLAPKASAGITGIGKTTVGVQGLSTHSVGVYGQSNKANTAGVMAKSSVANGLALEAVATGAQGRAAFLDGGVQINGTVNVTGNINIIGDFQATGMKSAVLPHPDGSQRLVYCMESPQAWLEDFGDAVLVNGRAEVALDPDFAAVCDTESCRIFIGEGGDHHLHVARRDSRGFTVEADVALAALKGKSPGDLNGRFSYRVIGLRKDRPGERLAKFANG